MNAAFGGQIDGTPFTKSLRHPALLTGPSQRPFKPRSGAKPGRVRRGRSGMLGKIERSEPEHEA
jgi:hypothetical protein